jgi:hypothetical protein
MSPFIKDPQLTFNSLARSSNTYFIADITGIYKQPDTFRRGRVVNIYGSCSGGPGFKSWPEDWLSWLRVFVVFLSPFSQNPGIIP